MRTRTVQVWHPDVLPEFTGGKAHNQMVVESKTTSIFRPFLVSSRESNPHSQMITPLPATLTRTNGHAASDVAGDSAFSSRFAFLARSKGHRDPTFTWNNGYLPAVVLTARDSVAQVSVPRLRDPLFVGDSTRNLNGHRALTCQN